MVLRLVFIAGRPPRATSGLWGGDALIGHVSSRRGRRHYERSGTRCCSLVACGDLRATIITCPVHTPLRETGALETALARQICHAPVSAERPLGGLTKPALSLVAEEGGSTKLASLRVAPWRPARPLAGRAGWD